MSHLEHQADSPDNVRCAVITVSDTRTLETDTGGALVCELLTSAGHMLSRRALIQDEPATMRPLLEELMNDESIDAILMTGGTGIAARDQTYETVTELITKPIPGYGELFRMLSFEEIGAAAMLSRATGGLMQRTVLLTMPGSRAAVKLAMTRLINPELSHLVREARR